MTPDDPHPTTARVADLLDRDLGPEEARRLVEHLERCGACRRLHGPAVAVDAILTLSPPPVRSRRRRAAAALALAAAVTAALVLWSPRGTGPTPPAPEEDRGGLPRVLRFEIRWSRSRPGGHADVDAAWRPAGGDGLRRTVIVRRTRSEDAAVAALDLSHSLEKNR